MKTSETGGTDKKHPLDNRIPPPALLLMVGAVMVGIASITPVLDVDRIVALVVGSVVMILGLTISAMGVGAFGQSRTSVDPVNLDRASQLVTGGIFGYTRNPMYVGLTIVLIGWGLRLAAPWAFVGPPVFVWFLRRFQIAPEERFMRDKFGEAYDAYCARVRRWL